VGVRLLGRLGLVVLVLVVDLDLGVVDLLDLGLRDGLLGLVRREVVRLAHLCPFLDVVVPADRRDAGRIVGVEGGSGGRRPAGVKCAAMYAARDSSGTRGRARVPVPMSTRASSPRARRR